MLVATTGRLLDFVNTQTMFLGHVQHLVLDEADRMLDIGFCGDKVQIARAVHPERQEPCRSPWWPCRSSTPS